MTRGVEVVHARAGYGPVEVLHDVTMHFPLGAIVALLGRNGAGKSSLLRVIAGTLPLSSGHVKWHGRDITRLAPHQRVERGLTVVPDGANVFFDLSVAENLELFGGGAPLDAVYTVFPELKSRSDQRVGTLSGGERQMLALARVVLRPGTALLLDEVSRGLSAGAVQRLYSVVAELATADRAIVVVEQYQPDIVRRADVIYVLSRGRLSWAGEGSEVADGKLPAGLW